MPSALRVVERKFATGTYARRHAAQRPGIPTARYVISRIHAYSHAHWEFLDVKRIDCNA